MILNPVIGVEVASLFSGLRPCLNERSAIVKALQSFHRNVSRDDELVEENRQ
jgi:hypothetical protein